jgi:hypothetical protein
MEPQNSKVMMTLQFNRNQLKTKHGSLFPKKVRIFHLKKAFYEMALDADVVVFTDATGKYVIKDRREKKYGHKRH